MMSRRNSKIKSILIVDDNESILDIYKRLFEEEGYDVIIAKSGNECLDKLKSFKPDIILLDVVLPDIDGIELCKIIKHGISNIDDPHFVVLISSVLKESLLHAEGLQVGADGYILRPISNKDLVMRINAYHNHNQTFLTLFSRESNFRKAIYASADAIIIVNKKGRIVFVNPAACLIFNKPESELIGSEFGHPISTGTWVELTIRRDDRLSLIVEMRVTNTVWEEENMYYVSLRDITNRKNTQEEAIAQNEKTERILNNTQSGILVLKALRDKYDNIFDFSYQYVNNFIINVSGLTKEDFYTHSLLKLFPDSYKTKRFERYRDVVMNDKSVSFEEYFDSILKKGWYKFSIMKLSDGVVISVTDITDIKNQQMVVQEVNENLQKSKLERDKFYSLIAHDLRSLFNKTLGLSDLLSSDISEFSKEDIMKFSSRLNNSLRKQFELLDSLLKWSQIQIGKTKAEFADVDVLSLINQIRVDYSEFLAEKKIILNNLVDSKVSIKSDLILLRIILQNLIQNAIKFSYENSKIDVSVTKSKGYISINVRDYGTGIPQETAEKLFQITEFVTNKGTLNEEGTGLGLILCYDMAKLLNGELTFTTKVSKGTTFTFTTHL